MKRAVLLPRRTNQAAEYLLIDDDARIVERGTLAPDVEARSSGLETVVIVPGEAVLSRWLELPTRTEAQARAAAVLLIRDAVADESASGHVALGRRGEDDARLVAVVNPEILRGWLAQCTALGFTPSALVPDHLVTPEPPAGRAFAVRYGDQLAVRAERLAMTCEADLAPMILGERAITEIGAQERIEEAFAHAALSPPVNLLQGAFAVRGERSSEGLAIGPLLLAASLVAAALLSVPAAELIRKSRLAGQIEQRLEQEVVRIAPDAAGADPTATLRLLQAETGAASGTFGTATAGLFIALERTPTVRLNSLLYEAETGFRLNVSTPDYAAIEALGAALAAAGLVMEEGAAVQEAGGLVTDLTVRSAT